MCVCMYVLCNMGSVYLQIAYMYIHTHIHPYRGTLFCLRLYKLHIMYIHTYMYHTYNNVCTPPYMYIQYQKRG